MDKNKSFESGMSFVPVIIIVGILAVGGFAAYKFIPSTEDKMMEEKIIKEDKVMNEDGNMIGGNEMIEKDSSEETGQGDSMMKDDKMIKDSDSMMMEYSGKVLAGKSAPLIEYNKADFDKALKTDKLIVLYFYANWCPICRAEFPKMMEAFNELTSDKVVGFQVNYKDDQTDGNETDLAREHGVAYQHTKVFIKNDQRIGKYPDSWDKARYLTEINKVLVQ